MVKIASFIYKPKNKARFVGCWNKNPIASLSLKDERKSYVPHVFKKSY